MKKKPALKKCLFLLVLPVLAFTAFGSFGIDLFAETESRELDRLFGNLGILKVPPDADPLEITLNDPNGRPVSLSDLRGKIVFINFWTTWCLACVIEMPSMEKLHQKFKDKDFVMVGINLQESAERVKQFFKKHQLTFTTLLDITGDVGAALGINAIPTTLILDKNGRIAGRALGPREWESKESIALFEYLTDRYVASSNSKSVK
ncbi:MAG: TlpA disulfide reductase family protein [Desulfobacterales bacterium]|jgi:peroxiredoxin